MNSAKIILATLDDIRDSADAAGMCDEVSNIDFIANRIKMSLWQSSDAWRRIKSTNAYVRAALDDYASIISIIRDARANARAARAA